MMKAWEFLLQREGDRTWLPLETPTVEILEGRYRVVARTPRKEEEVDIYVSYVSTEDDPPKRRVQQRSRQTNPEGLVAFLPFTTLRTGRWELRCRPHVEPGSLEYQWPAVIQLQVLEQEVASTDDLFGWDMPDAPAEIPTRPSSLTPPSSGEVPASPSELLQTGLSPDEDPGDIQKLAERMSQMVVDSVLSVAGAEPGDADSSVSGHLEEGSADTPEGDVDPGSQEVGLEATDSGAAPTTRETSELPDLVPITLTLREETLTLPDSRTVSLVGEIETIAPQASLPPMVVMVELRDPNTTEVWVSQQQEIPSIAQPTSSYAFEQQLTVPTSCSSQLLLGTATVWQRQSDSELQVLTAANFTTMAPVDALLSNVAATDGAEQQSSDGTIETLQQKAASNFVVSKLGMEPTVARANRRINSDLLELLKPGSGGSSYKPTSGRVLPPQLSSPATPKEGKQADSPEPTKRTIDLPSFGARNPVFESKPFVEESSTDESSVRPSDQPLDPTENLSSNPFAFPAETGEDGAPPALEKTVKEGEADAGPYAIPEGASLEELAELFGPPPELNNQELQNSQRQEDAQSASPSSDELPQAENIAQQRSESTPAAGGSPERSTAAPLSEEAAGLSAEQIVLPAALAGATFQLAATNDATSDISTSTPETLALADAEAPQDFGEASGSELPGSAPLNSESLDEESESADPFMNRLHELTVPQPQVERPSPVLLAEVVVEDEDLPPTRLAWMQKDTAADSAAEAIAVDAPDLQVPEKELVVGETIRVSIRLSAEPSQLCARLWLLDCQTRTLLTEPQWVTAFLPFSEEQVEATLEVKIPEGSVELQIEAIAIDPDSKRESRKVAVRRTVTLPDNVEAAPEDNRFNPWMT